jgi:hypothetical protein
MHAKPDTIMNQQQEDNSNSPAEESRKKERQVSHYKVQFRPAEQLWSASTRLYELQKGEVVMVQTDHGLEPARLLTIVPLWPEQEPSKETVDHYQKGDPGRSCQI